MKQIFLISASLAIASGAFAQTDDNMDNTLYHFDNAGSAKEVRKLGTAPEFPFLRNMTSSHQVYNAIKKHDDDNSTGMNKLNGLLMQIGYTNGAKDLKASDISETQVPLGTEGNMGSRGYTYAYYRLGGDPSEFKAWKIAPNKDGNSNGYGALYIFAKCGNAFFPKNGATACVTAPVNLTGDMKQITLNAGGSVAMTNNEVYVYYAHRRGKKHECANPIAMIDDKYPSKPIMVSSTKDATVIPETYNITLNGPQNNVTVCPDATLDVTANINVEKTSSYTGNYPKSDNKTYTKVTKHQYKMVARRMRRIHRKEDKIARRTNMTVDVATSANKA